MLDEIITREILNNPIRSKLANRINQKGGLWSAIWTLHKEGIGEEEIKTILLGYDLSRTEVEEQVYRFFYWGIDKKEKK